MRGRTGPFRRSHRLLRSREFQHVARHGQKAVVRGFVVLAAPRTGDPVGLAPRLGVTVSKRVGNAVVRNHVKRRIREWFRGECELIDPSMDLVVIGRPAAAQLAGREISRQLERATRELRVLAS